MVGCYLELDELAAILENLRPASLDTDALDGEERLSARERVSNEETRGVPDTILFLFRLDGQVVSGRGLPEDLSFADAPALECARVFAP